MSGLRSGLSVEGTKAIGRSSKGAAPRSTTRVTNVRLLLRFRVLDSMHVCASSVSFCRAFFARIEASLASRLKIRGGVQGGVPYITVPSRFGRGPRRAGRESSQPKERECVQVELNGFIGGASKPHGRQREWLRVRAPLQTQDPIHARMHHKFCPLRKKAVALHAQPCSIITMSGPSLSRHANAHDKAFIPLSRRATGPSWSSRDK